MPLVIMYVQQRTNLKKNKDTPDIIVLPEPMEPSVQPPDNDELRRAVKRKFDKAMAGFRRKIPTLSSCTSST